MNSNQTNHRDGSYHIYHDAPKPKPKKERIDKTVEIEKKEVKKNDKKANRK